MTQERCKATHVVQCVLMPGHYLSHEAAGFWTEGAPQPRIEISAEMRRRAREAFNEYASTRRYDNGTMRIQIENAALDIALDAAFNGDTK